jgi:hypothetical protein
MSAAANQKSPSKKTLPSKNPPSRLLKKLNIDLPFDPAIPLLGIYPTECDTGYSRGTCTPMFIAAVFTIAKLWKQPRCPTLTNGSRKCGIYTQWNFTQP